MSRRIVDPYEYDNLVSAENKAYVKDFLIEKRAQNRTKKTLKQYEQDMRIVLTDIYRNFDNKLLTKLTRKDIRNLLIIWQDRNLSAARVNRLRSSLSSCLEYLVEDDDVEGYENNPALRVKGLPPNPVRQITFLTEDQIHWLRDALLGRGNTLMAVYLMLSYVSAARRNEVHQVLKDGLTERFKTNIVVGKRQKRFPLYYDQETQELIKRYLDERGPDDNPYLFVKIYLNGKKEHVNPATFNDWCLAMGRMISLHEGKQIRLNPHCFRHSRIEHLCRVKGFPLEKVKSLVNHSSVATTETYLADRSEDDVMELFGMEVDT